MRRDFTGILVAGALLACVPLAGLPLFYESFLYLVFYWIVLATSWNILSGYSGYFSFGHGAFHGAGMYTSAVLATRYDIPFLWTLPAAALVALTLGVVLGAIVFRVRTVRGELFALVTLAFTFVVGTIVLNTPIDGGPGIAMAGVAVRKLGKSAASSFYLMALVLAMATVLIACAVYHSKLGTGLFAIHDDEDVAEVLGVPTYRYKLVAFALSCALAGMAGGIHALFVSYVTANETFSITVPLTVVLMSVLGGTRHWAGPAIGATAITALLYAFTVGNHPLAGKAVFGAILIAVILFLPRGILGAFGRHRARKRGAARTKDRHADATSGPASAASVDVAARDAAVADASTADAAMAGTAATDAARAPIGETLFAARNLCKGFRGVQALDGVNVEIRRGEILGLVGPNGSGKSTFINMVSGHYRADTGALVFGGVDLAGQPAHRIARAGIARTYQIPRPFAHLTVLENVALPAMFGTRALARRAALDEARRWLDFTGLTAVARALPDELNLHQRKFLELARALASRPRLLLLDEVLSGLTPGEIVEAIRLVRAIRDDGATIVFVEHVMRAVMALSDRIVVLDQGRVIADGEAAVVMASPAVVTAFLGAPHA